MTRTETVDGLELIKGMRPDQLAEKYPKCRSALRWWCGNVGKSIYRHAYLKDFMIENPPDFMISDYCCTGAKKRPAHATEKKLGAVLNVTGERRAENGRRSTIIKSCFYPKTEKHTNRFYAVFYFSDADKRAYEEAYGVTHSRCYTEYGMARTGCAACPFGSKFEEELTQIAFFEPKLYKAAVAIFGQAYDYTRRYRAYSAARKEQRKQENAERRKARRRAKRAEEKAKRQAAAGTEQEYA